ncbi:hypothetical protein Hdeb2414_s0068g00769861 [Helianthus debilis subsp. tardiflorus]
MSVFKTLHLISCGYVVVQEKLPNYVVPDLTDFKVIILRAVNEPNEHE